MTPVLDSDNSFISKDESLEKSSRSTPFQLLLSKFSPSPLRLNLPFNNSPSKEERGFSRVWSTPKPKTELKGVEKSSLKDLSLDVVTEMGEDIKENESTKGMELIENHSENDSLLNTVETIHSSNMSQGGNLGLGNQSAEETPVDDGETAVQNNEINKDLSENDLPDAIETIVDESQDERTCQGQSFAEGNTEDADDTNLEVISNESQQLNAVCSTKFEDIKKENPIEDLRTNIVPSAGNVKQDNSDPNDEGNDGLVEDGGSETNDKAHKDKNSSFIATFQSRIRNADLSKSFMKKVGLGSGMSKNNSKAFESESGITKSVEDSNVSTSIENINEEISEPKQESPTSNSCGNLSDQKSTNDESHDEAKPLHIDTNETDALASNKEETLEHSEKNEDREDLVNDTASKEQTSSNEVIDTKVEETKSTTDSSLEKEDSALVSSTPLPNSSIQKRRKSKKFKGLKGLSLKKTSKKNKNVSNSDVQKETSVEQFQATSSDSAVQESNTKVQKETSSKKIIKSKSRFASIKKSIKARLGLSSKSKVEEDDKDRYSFTGEFDDTTMASETQIEGQKESINNPSEKQLTVEDKVNTNACISDTGAKKDVKLDASTSGSSEEEQKEPSTISNNVKNKKGNHSPIKYLRSIFTPKSSKA